MPLSPQFWRLAAATGVSNLSDGLVGVVLPLVALQSTGSALVVAAVAAATRLPWLLFALVAGVIIDRVDRRLLMTRAQMFRAAGLALLLVVMATGSATAVSLCVVALLLGTAEVLYDSASQTILPAVVPKESLPAANGRLFGVEATANTFIGPPLGGLLVSLSAPIAIAAGSLSYFTAGMLVRSIPGNFRPRAEGKDRVPPAQDPGARRRLRLLPAGSWSPAAMGRDIREGMHFLFAHTVLRRLTVLVAVSSFTMAAIGVVLPVHAVDPGPLGLQEAGYGLLIASSGIGAVLASLLSERLVARLSPEWTLRAAIVVVALTQALLLSTHPVVVGALLAAMSFFVVLWNVVTISYRQAVVPDALLGRVNSAYRMCAWGSAPLGALAGGLLTTATSTSTAFLVAGACTALMIPVVAGLRRGTLAAAAA